MKSVNSQYNDVEIVSLIQENSKLKKKILDLKKQIGFARNVSREEIETEAFPSIQTCPISSNASKKKEINDIKRIT